MKRLVISLFAFLLDVYHAGCTTTMVGASKYRIKKKNRQTNKHICDHTFAMSQIRFTWAGVQRATTISTQKSQRPVLSTQGNIKKPRTSQNLYLPRSTPKIFFPQVQEYPCLHRSSCTGTGSTSCDNRAYPPKDDDCSWAQHYFGSIWIWGTNPRFQTYLSNSNTFGFLHTEFCPIKAWVTNNFTIELLLNLAIYCQDGTYKCAVTITSIAENTN